MTGMTLIIDLVRVIHEVPLFNKPLDALIHHHARDAVLEDCLFDRLLTESVLVSGLVSHADIKRNRLVTSGL